MAGRKSPKPPRQPRQVQKRTGSAGKPKSDPGPKKASEAPQHTARRGQQSPAAPTKATGAPFPQQGHEVTSVPMLSGRKGLREKQPGDPSIFQKADAGNRRLGRRNRPGA
jgi:hypothetical protein